MNKGKVNKSNIWPSELRLISVGVQSSRSFLKCLISVKKHGKDLGQMMNTKAIQEFG